jgi:hypothetical protein
MGLEQLNRGVLPKFDLSGMEKRVEAVENNIVEKLVYYSKDGKEFILLASTVSKDKLAETKKRIEENLAVLNDPAKVQTSKDALAAQLADLDAKIGLVK